MFVDTEKKQAGEVAERVVESQEVRNLRRLIEYMDGLDDPNFTMEFIEHFCGAPACAYGNAYVLFGGVAQAIKALGTFQDTKTAHWDGLFAASLSKIIQTPQQWAAHARAYLVAQGY